MFVLRINSKSYIKFVGNGDILVIQDPSRATKFARAGEAMEAASQLNKDWEDDIIKFVRIQ